VVQGRSKPAPRGKPAPRRKEKIDPTSLPPLEALDPNRCHHIYPLWHSLANKQCGMHHALLPSGFCGRHDPNKDETRRLKQEKREERIDKVKVDMAAKALASLGSNVVKDVRTLDLLMSGVIRVSDLTWDELVGGYIYQRDAHGNIIAKHTPLLIPRQFYIQVTQALFAQAEQRFRQQFDGAMKALVHLVESDKTPARERLAAATYVIDRVIGKIPDKQLIDMTVSTFQEIVNSGELIVDVDAEDVVD
jgi:hypothetical protein